MKIYTDGSCLGNPGPGGWACLFLDDDSRTIIKKNAGFELDTTNNRMEMMAVLQSLEAVKKHPKTLYYDKIELYSDSNLIIQTLKQGWKRKANLDLWLKIDRARANLPIEFYWVKGHSVDKYNNLCDKLAQRQAQKALRISKLKGVKTDKKPSKKLSVPERIYQNVEKTNQQSLF